MRRHAPEVAIVATFLIVALAGCKEKTFEEPRPPPVRISVDGSSTVLPITDAIVRRYAEKSPTLVVTNASGTGGGFKKFCIGKAAIVGASRPILSAESKTCEQNGIKYIEMPIAFDGISVVVHPDNTWATSLTVAELKKLWEPAAQGVVVTWADLRPGWPAEKIELYGPGLDSGTFDYFTKAIVGEEKACRGDFHSAEDDDVLVAGVASSRYALGYFGYAYYVKNKDRLKLVAIDDGNPVNGAGAITPSAETIASGAYAPLSRPLFLYVSQIAAGHKQTQNFITYYLDQVSAAAHEVGYVALPPNLLALARRRFQHRQPGTAFDGGGIEVGLNLAELLEAETQAVVARPN